MCLNRNKKLEVVDNINLQYYKKMNIINIIY